MDINQINEELRQIINELSPELKGKVRDLRHAQYLADQASADLAQEKANKSKAKYDRFIAREKRTQTKTQDEIENSFKEIAKTFSFTKTYPTMQEKGNDFYIILSDVELIDGKLTQSAEEELKKLLIEMSEKYGCTYSYKIVNNQVQIICENPKIEGIAVFYLDWLTDEEGGELYTKPDKYTHYKVIVISYDLKDLKDDYEYGYIREGDGYFHCCGYSTYSLVGELLDDTCAWQEVESFADIDFDEADLDIPTEIQEKILNNKRSELTDSECEEIINAYEMDNYTTCVVKLEPYTV